MLNIGIVGCGTIGAKLAKYIQADLKPKAHLAAICDTDENKISALSATLKDTVQVLLADELIHQVDLIVEAAAKEVAARLLSKAVKAGRDILIMSVGGLLNQESLLAEARGKGVRVYMPSGAICGLDGLKAAAMGRITKVILTTRKPPLGLAGAPYIIENKIDLTAIKKETLIFEGSALDAVRGFPKNINVAAALSLAGPGLASTKVKIITSPEYKTNSHEIEVEGEFGRFLTRTDNVPSPDNPRTSYLAVLSAMAVLKQIIDPVKIGA